MAPRSGSKFHYRVAHERLFSPEIRFFVRQGSAALWESFSNVALVGVFALALTAALYFGRYLVVPITASIILGMTFGPIVDIFVRRRLPAPFVAAVLLAAGFGGIGGMLYGLAIPLEQWSARLPEVWDEVRGELGQLRKPIENIKEMEESVEGAVGRDQGVEVTVKKTGVVTSAVFAAPPAIAQFGIFAASLYFFLAYRQQLRRSMLRMCVNQRYRLRTARIFRDVEYFLSRYIISIALINTVFGLIVGLAMFLLGVPSPHLWGVLAAVLNFVPYVGPAVMTLILVGVGIAEFEGIGHSLVPALVYLGLNFMEGQFVTPTVLGRTFSLNPFIIFVALAFWMWLWGPIGGFVAVPLVLVLMVGIFRTTTGTAQGPTAPAPTQPAVNVETAPASIASSTGNAAVTPQVSTKVIPTSKTG